MDFETQQKFLESSATQMLSPDYKQRFVGEFVQLKIRADRLESMLDRWKRGELDFKPTCSRGLLSSQLIWMRRYQACLEERASIEGVSVPDEMKTEL